MLIIRDNYHPESDNEILLRPVILICVTTYYQYLRRLTEDNINAHNS